jgi:hypothetical protein
VNEHAAHPTKPPTLSEQLGGTIRLMISFGWSEAQIRQVFETALVLAEWDREQPDGQGSN